jgi:hypothetical protein
MPQDTLTRIAIIGAGKLGAGLAARCAKAGYDVIVGSRDAAKAARIAADLNQALGGDHIRGAANVEAASQADIVVLATPYSAQRETLDALRPALRHKILLTVVNALNPENIRQVKLPAISAAVEAQAQLGEDVKVVAAFQTLMYRVLSEFDAPIECDTFVAGNDAGAKRQVARLAQAIGMWAWDIGPIENAVAAETFAAVIMHLGAQHGSKTAGLRVTGI